MRAGIGLGTRPKLTCQPLGERSRMLRWTEQTEHLRTELWTQPMVKCPGNFDGP
jgi:hypothetical protein